MTREADIEVHLVPIAAAIVDVWMGSNQEWRSRLDDSDFLESADWQNAMQLAQAAYATVSKRIEELEGDWFDKAIRDHCAEHGPSGGAWNISMVLERLHRARSTLSDKGTASDVG